MRYIIKKLKKLQDTRQPWKTKHPLYEIISICIIASICGASSSCAIFQFAKLREKWLRKFLPLQNGIPSRYTIERTLRILNPRRFEEWFNIIMQKVNKDTKGSVIAIDGKCFFTERARDDSKNPLYIISAWCAHNGMVLAHQKTKEKSNEITSIPLLLKCLKIPQSIVTIDAIGCQTNIVRMIYNDNKANYCIALKENQPTMYKEMVAYAEDCLSDPLLSSKYQTHITRNKGHGRIEKRVYTMFLDLSWFKDIKNWIGLTALVRVESTRTIKGISTTFVRYYITSLSDIEQAANAIRSHWSIENNLHWVLDVVFHEDDCHTRIENEAANLSTIRKLALTFLRAQHIDIPIKGPISGPMKMYACALNPQILEQVLLGSNVFS
jgi:predicted transposase YbfD/YdcC